MKIPVKIPEKIPVKDTKSDLPEDSEKQLPETAVAVEDNDASTFPNHGDPVAFIPDAAEEAKKELLYLRAEFDNYRKRMARDQEAAVRFANERLVKDLLSTLDLFDRALAHSAALKGESSPAVKTFVEGIELTSRELSQTLVRFGIEFTGAVGEVFDPSKHEAISEQESNDVESGTIIAVLARGCFFQGRLIQPAKVVVSKKNVVQ